MIGYRILFSAFIAPVALGIAGVAIVNAKYDGVGLAPVPFLLTAYVLGVAAWGVMSLLLPTSFCFKTVLVAFGICGISVVTQTNTQTVLWLVGAPAVGGIAATAPYDAIARKTSID